MSCQEGREGNEKTPTNVEGESKQMVLGVQKENPYALETMQMVLDTIIKAKSVDNPNLRTAEIILETTDLYVRFLPSNEYQLNALQQDSLLVFLIIL